MVKEIELPDGSIGEFPDDMPDLEIEKVLQREFSSGDSSAASPVPSQPADNRGMGEQLADFAKGAATETFRTFGGAAGDFIGNTTNFLYDVADVTLRNPLYNLPAAVGGEEEYDAALADLKAGADLYTQVPQPDATLNKFLRPVTSLGAGMVAPNTLISRALPTVGPLARGAASGAVADFTATNPADPNLGNLAEQELGVSVPTAKREGDSVWLRRFKDVVEGGALGAAADTLITAAGRAFSKTGKAVSDIRAQDLTEDALDEVLVNEETRRLLEANGVFDPKDPDYGARVAQAEERLAARREAEASRQLPPQETTVRQTIQENERLRAEQEAVASGEINPAAASTAGRQTVPERPIRVTPEGQAVVSSEPRFDPDQTRARAEDIQAAERATVQQDFTDIYARADLEARRGPEYQEARATAERDARARGEDPNYAALSRRIGTDPAELVARELEIPVEQFRALPDSARERVVDAAQRQATARADVGPALRTSDAALSEGQARYSPATEPTARVEGGPRDGTQPTRAELDSAQPQPAYARAASGTSDRPFVGRDANLDDTQNARFEEDARFRAEEARKATVEDLERRWQERASARESTGESRNAGAEKKYQGYKASEFSNTAKAQSADGRFETDEFGYVRSSKEGPLKFADQKQAARWIVNRGHKNSPDQIFEIDNHPSGRGYTVREYGKSEPPPEGRKPGGDAQSESGSSTPTRQDAGSSESAMPVEPQRLPAPERAGASSAGQAGGPDSTRNSAASRPGREARRSAEEPNPAPTTEGETHAPTAQQTRSGSGQTPGRPDASAPENQKPRKPEGTRDTGDPAELGLKEQAKSSTSLNRTLYSTPFDPALARELLGEPFMRVFQKEKEEFLKELRALSRTLKRPGGPNKKNVGQVIADFGRVIGNTNRGMFNLLVDRYPQVTALKEMRDMLASQPGTNQAIKETYNEVLDRRPVQRLQQALNIFGKKQDNEAFMDAVADHLSGRKKAARGSEEFTVAGRIRRLLDQEYDYLTKSDVELGYVKENYYPRALDKQAVMNDPSAFMDRAADIYRKMGLGKTDAKEAAEEWYHRVLGVGRNNFTVSDFGPDNKFTKGRKLPKEADTILKDFYITDPVENLATYFRQTTNRAEFTKRFGKNGEKADEMFDQMLREGVRAQDVDIARQAFDSITGNIGGRTPDVLRGITSWIQTLGTLTLLPRAIVASFPESMAVGVRSGRAMDSLEAFFDGWRAAFGSEDLADQRAAAEAIGIVGHAHQQMILAQRFGGGMDSKWQNRILTNFFNRTGLQPLTEGQRVAATGIGQGFVRRMLKDAQGGNRVQSAKELLAELGIAEADISTLTKWLGEDVNVPVKKLLEDSEPANMYRTAIARFVDESIQNPKAVDRPALANHPIGRMMYSIMSFQYAFTRNVLFRTAKRVGRGLNPRSELSAADRARYIGILLPFTMLMAGQMGTSRLREYAYNPEGQKERTDVERVLLDISRSGITGALDPIVNAVASVKYERDLSNIVIGANAAFFMERMAKIAGLIPNEWGGKNNPDTNNAEWSATRAAYQMLVTPLAHVALSLAPGGAMVKTASGALMAGPYPIGISTPQTSRAVADTLVGERDIAPRAEGKTSSARSSTRSTTRSTTRTTRDTSR